MISQQGSLMLRPLPNGSALNISRPASKAFFFLLTAPQVVKPADNQSAV